MTKSKKKRTEITNAETHWAIYMGDSLASQGSKLAVYHDRKDAEKTLKYAKSAASEKPWRIARVLISELPAKRKKK